MGLKRAEGPRLEARRTREERMWVRRPLRRRSWGVELLVGWFGFGGRVMREEGLRTCQAKGRFLRFRRAKRMARNFQMLARLEGPSLERRGLRLKLGAIVDGLEKGVDSE